jgi:chorismate synthase
MLVPNRDHESWAGRMGPEPFAQPPEPLVRARPGHADLAGGIKYGRHDLRDVLERASARETAMRVAVGAVCKRLLEDCGVGVFAHVRSIGDVRARVAGDWEAVRAAAAADDLRCADPEASAAMRAAIHAASHRGDTLGGVFEVVALGVPVGLGSHVMWDRKLDGRLAQAVMSIQAIKAVEIGLGLEAAARLGSEVHDPIAYEPDPRGGGRFVRSRNGAGGLEGGITNGEPVVVRGAMKPIATLRDALPSVDVRTKEPARAATERSDICAVAAASVVAEAMVAFVLADALLEKLGGDSMDEVRERLAAWRERVRAY